METNLDRFIIAQQKDYASALKEIRSGQKSSHWMWYIFPQLKGLGRSETAEYYGIRDLEEATAFLRHPFLGKNLVAICKVLEDLKGKTAREIFGSPDDLKLNSCLTLFSMVKESNPVFELLISKYYDGAPDPRTLQMLQE